MLALLLACCLCYGVAAVAALLAAYTFDARTGAHTRLMTVQESPLGAAYRNLTGLSPTSTATATTTANASTGLKPAGSSPRLRDSVAAMGPSGSSTTPAQPHSSPRLHCTASAPAARQTARHFASKARAPCSSGADVVSAAAVCAGSRSRALRFATPLQPIMPTETLSAAAAGVADDVSGNGLHGDSGASLSAASRLQFHISVLSRFPFLLKELTAMEPQAASAAADPELQAVQVEAAGSAAAEAAIGAGATISALCSSSSTSTTTSHNNCEDGCCVVSQPPSVIQAKPGLISMGAYLEHTRLQQVRASRLLEGLFLGNDAQAAWHDSILNDADQLL